MAETSLNNLGVLSRKSNVKSENSQIPVPRFNWKTRILLPGLILGGFAALFVATSHNAIVASVAVDAEPVIVKNVQGPVAGAATVQAAGWVEADPYKSYVSALADGVVREVLVLEGDSVQQGQIVVRLVDDDAKLAVEEAEAKVQELEAVLASAKADRTAAESDWENPVERQRAIDVGTAELAESRALLKQSEAEILMEESRLEHAKSDYDRAVPLHGSTAISESELVRLRSQFSAQKAKLESMRARNASIRARIAKHEAELTAAKRHMELRTEERQELDRARAKVFEAQAALKHAKTVLTQSRLTLSRMEIRSLVAGVVMRRLTEPGAKLVLNSDEPHSAQVLSVYDPNRLQVRVDVPLADAGKLGVGQPAEISVEVIPDRVFSGTVTRVLHEADIQKNTLEAKVSITKPDPKLRPEMLARVRFLANVKSEPDEVHQGIFAPKKGVRGNGKEAYTMIVSEFDGSQGIAMRRPLNVGRLKTDGWVIVLQGLNPGDLIITKSAEPIESGQRVRVKGSRTESLP
jgi:HlyD family secretion protein